MQTPADSGQGAPLSLKAKPLRSSLGENLVKVTETCTECGLCRKECGFLEQYGTPKAIAERYDPETKEGQVMPFECSLCRLCNAVCPFGVNPSGMFLEMRREAVDRSAGSFAEHAGLLAYERQGMSPRFTWYGLPKDCQTVFFPGCALPGTRPERTEQLYETLRRQDPNMGIVLDCCGKISHDLGREAFFQTRFDDLKGYLLAQGVREVLVACPNCHSIFEQYGDGLQVRMIYEVLPKNALPQAAATGEVILHDPCGTRFHEAAQADVRRLIRGTGISLKDMKHTGRKTLCCGSGGSVNALSPELADRWTELNSREALGHQIATYCCGCANRLNSSVPTLHALDLLFEPKEALAGRSPVSKAPLTYLNRIRLKRHFQKTVDAALCRKRPRQAEEGKNKAWIGRLLILALLAAAIVAIRVTDADRYLDQETLRQLIGSYGILAPLIYMLIYTVAPALLLPGLPLTIAGGILFGPFWGVVYTITSATAGACLAFLISRYIARDWVGNKLRSPRWRRLDEGVEQHGWKVVAFTRLIPLFPFNLLNYAFGLTKIRFWPYAITTFITMLPACIAFIVFSSSLLDLIRGRISPSLLIGIGLLLLVSLLPLFYRRYRKRKGGTDPV